MPRGKRTAEASPSERQPRTLSYEQVNRLALIFTRALPYVAKHGLAISADESRAMLSEFVRVARGRHSVDAPKVAALQAFMLAGVERYLSSEASTLDRAFELAPRRGRRRAPQVWQKRLAIAIEVKFLMKKRGLTRDAAIDLVSCRRGEKFEYVRDAYDDLKFEAKVAMRPPRPTSE